jgi:hypothetical protein
MLKRIRLRALFLGLCLLHAAQASKGALFTPSDKNVAVLEEAAITNFFLIGQVLGNSDPNQLTISSGVFSPSSWSFSLTGTYSGMPATLSFTGTFDTVSNTGSYTSSGSVGPTNLQGSGSWAWTDTSAVQEGMNYGASLTSVSVVPPKEFDTETIGEKTYSAEGPFFEDTIVEDKGSLQTTFGGQPVIGAVQAQHSIEYVPATTDDELFGGSGGAMFTFGDFVLIANDSFPSDTLTGFVATAPEPTALLQFAICAGCVLAHAGLRNRQRMRLRGKEGQGQRGS